MKVASIRYTLHLMPHGRVLREEENESVGPRCAQCGTETERLALSDGGHSICFACFMPKSIHICAPNMVHAAISGRPLEDYHGMPVHPDVQWAWAPHEQVENSKSAWAEDEKTER